MGKKILIVDDTSYIRKILREILEESGHKVVGEGKNGVEAVELAEKLLPEIIIMDIVMPGKNGIEAMIEIKKKFPNIKIVLMSALGQERLIMDAINAGAQKFIIKPFKKENIISTIEKI
jgi:two-component system chemotaxis response regulator CheY